MNAKKITILVFFVILSTISSANAQTVPAVSPMATVSQRIGITDVLITYHRPQVKGRKIWGALVPYGYSSYSSVTRKNEAPWWTGANAASTISFPHDVTINKQPLKAGTYGLFMAVFENGTVDVIFSRNTKSLGSLGFTPKNIVLKITVQSEKTSQLTEMMTFLFYETTATSSKAALLWEYKKIPFHIEVDTHTIVLENLKLEQYSPLAYSNRVGWSSTAAIYCMNNNVHLEQGITWIKAATDGSGGIRDFVNLSTYANLLMMNNQMDEANTILKEVFAIPANDIGAGTLTFYGGQVLSVGKGFPDVAIRTYKFLEENFPKNKWAAKNGLAKAYSAKGDYATALKHLKAAKQFAPEKYDVETYEKQLQKLKNGKNID